MAKERDPFDVHIQRRGRPGIAPGSLFRREHNLLYFPATNTPMGGDDSSGFEIVKEQNSNAEMEPQMNADERRLTEK
jgi:hypothetical protein